LFGSFGEVDANGTDGAVTTRVRSDLGLDFQALRVAADVHADGKAASIVARCSPRWRERSTKRGLIACTTETTASSSDSMRSSSWPAAARQSSTAARGGIATHCCRDASLISSRRASSKSIGVRPPVLAEGVAPASVHATLPPLSAWVARFGPARFFSSIYCVIATIARPPAHPTRDLRRELPPWDARRVRGMAGTSGIMRWPAHR
jgi:hypothetical protein